MSHLATPTALGCYVAERLATDATPVLEAGWITSLLEHGHSPEVYPDFMEAVLLAAVRASGGVEFPTFAAYLSHVHEEHALTMPRRVCGYMFKQNDISWSCRDCEMDETCVQCQACFQASDHTGHQVFFHRTSPGGMCDCGDTEAWKVPGMCPTHQPSDSAAMPTDTLLAFPPALARTLHDVLLELIVYMVDVSVRCTNNHDPAKVAEKLKPKKRKLDADDLPTLYHVRISNDDVHTDQDLTGSLIDKGYSVAFAEQFTQAVDADGARLLKEKVLLPEALQLMHAMEAEGWLTSIVDDDHLRREAVWDHLLRYVHGLALLSPSLQHALFALLFEPIAAASRHYPHVPAEMEPIVELLTASSVLPKPIVLGLQQAYLNVMGDRALKWQFALFYVEVYQLVMREFFCGVGTKNEAMFGLSVQIFTTPSIVPQLVEDRALLTMLLHVLQEGLELTKGPDKHDATLDTVNLEHIVVRFARYEPVVTDLGFVLLVPTVATAFLDHMGTWCCLLREAGHLNLQRRVPETKPHVEIEDNMPWYNALMLHVALASVTESFFKGRRATSRTLDAATGRRLLGVLWAEARTDAAGLSDDNFRVEASPVSVHYPLLQMLGYLCLELLHFGETPLREALDVLEANDWAPLRERPLRAFVFAAQVGANLWVRNGQELMKHELTSYCDQSYYFPTLAAHVSFRDLDLVLLQVAVLLDGPAPFLRRFLRRHDVPSAPWPPEKRAPLVAGALLQLLWLLTELPPPREQSVLVPLRRKLVHCLAYKPCAYSTLRDQTTSVYAYPGFEGVPEDQRNKHLLAVLAEVADGTAAADAIAPAKFALKPAAFSEYDPAAMHLSSSRHVKAQEARSDAVFKAWTPEQPPIPMVAALPAAHEEMAPVRCLALLPELSRLLRRCLRDPLLGADETVLGRVVHLLTVQLLVLQDHPDALAAVVAALQADPADGDDTDDADVNAGGDHACGTRSLIGLLAAKAVRWRSQNEASLKPLLSGLLFVLRAYAAMDPVLSSFLATDVLPSAAATETEPLDHKARLAMQKQKQQQAMAAMLQRQSQFAGMLDADADADADTDDDDTAEQPTPECIICAHVKKDDPVMFIGLAQASDSIRTPSAPPAVLVQLCGHAVHLSCVEQYRSTMLRDSDASALSSVAFDATEGEFLCPLCKALSSVTVPFVPRPPACPIKAEMEAFFTGAASVDAVTQHLAGLPNLVATAPPDAVPLRAKDAVRAFLQSLKPAVARLTPTEQAQTVLETVAHAFDAAEMQGLSAALIHLVYADAAPSASHRLGVDLPPAADEWLDPFSPRDDAKFHALVLLLRRLPLFVDIGPGVAAAVAGTTTAAAALAALEEPLLGQDLFITLLLACSRLENKAQILWTIRAFAALHMVQVVLQCLAPCTALVDATDATDGSDAAPVEAWRAHVAADLGIDVPPTAPRGRLLQLAFETTAMVFLRKATLLARAVFRGPDDPDTALYLNFANHLHLASHLPTLCQQLGVPPPGELFASSAFAAWLRPHLQAWHRRPLALPSLAVTTYTEQTWAAHRHVTPLASMYTDLYARHSGHRCPTTQQPMETAALCMRCGVAVCAGTDCCKVDGRGACSQHVERCGHGNGAFFLLKACSMLLVSVHGRACFFASPYVDEFGEEDLYVKRGRPLQLRAKRLMVLFQLMIGHGIASEVAKARRTSEQYIRTYFY
ncbi:hypothetical protein ACHHYP_14197 [Achlya hypogyna]|uniref:E3 ubiquitin-protein ligase n=1 Tax=Achlya hypogyna TaxID=1202772 RepID=A0A1V9YDN6_ACHHY|nr:hypothetical protein ACHHYP_14197 [Achlya hypogyna]